MEQITHNNHYVPQLYLKNWSDIPDKVWRYRLLVSHKNVPIWDHPSIESVASQYNLYNYIRNDTETDEFEKWFNIEIETPCQIIIDKIIKGIILEQEEIKLLTKYVAAQFVRTPARLNKQLKFYTERLPAVVDRALKREVAKLERDLKEGKPLPKNEIDELSKLIPAKISIEKNPDNDENKLKYEAILGRGLWLYEIKHVINNTSKVLTNHRWEIIKAARGVNWCTSDDPVICLNYNNINNYNFNGGWNRGNSEIILPLSPHYVLYTKIGCEIKHPEFQENPYFTYLIQKFTIEHAHRNIFAFKPFNSIADCKKRIVNDVIYKQEADMWKNWYAEQNKAEQDLRNNNEAI